MRKNKQAIKALVSCALTTSIITSVTSNIAFAKEAKDNVKVENHIEKDTMKDDKNSYTIKSKSNNLKYNTDSKSHNQNKDSATVKAISDLRIKWKNDLTGGENIDLKNPAVKSKVIGYEKQTKTALDQLNKDASKEYLWEDCKDFKTKSSHITSMYKKVYSMAMAYNIKGSKYYHDPTIKQDIIYCLDWIQVNAYNKHVAQYDNWWDWQIGSPSQLVNISILMYNDLSDEQKVNYMESIQQFLQIIEPGSKYHTGANLADVCLIRLLQGAILNDTSKMQDASDKIISVFDKVTEHDGFYVDGSFVQHGKVAYTGSYGNVLLEKLSNMLFLTEGTQWQIKIDAKNNIYSWVFDSFDPIIYKGYVMDMVRGRSISRYNGSGYDQASGIIESIVRLSTVTDTNTAKNLKSLVKQWQKEATHMEYGKKLKSINMIQEFYTLMNDSNVQPKKQEDEHHAFNCMDKTVHERQDYALGISRSSKRISKYEYMNDENLKPWFQGDGMTYLFNNDLTQFSEDFWPTIDPMRLPGTTVDTRERPNATGTTDKDFYKMSHASWSGGTTLGKYGVSGMEIINKVENPSTQAGIYNNYDNLHAKKSWFMFDNEIVALGSGITSQDKYNVETIIENRKIKKDGTNKFIVDGQNAVKDLGSKDKVDNAKWAYLQGNVPGSDIGYYFPNGSNINILRDHREGKWADINTGKNDGDKLRENNYLTMYLDHGANPQNQGYSYVLLPNKSAKEVEAYSNNPQIEIVRNDEVAHGVRHKALNMEGANFWTHGTNTSGIITSTGKSSVMVRENKDNTLSIAVSDPTFEQKSITIEIDKPGVEIISKDDRISNVKLENGKIKFNVNTENSQGLSYNLVVKLG